MQVRDWKIESKSVRKLSVCTRRASRLIWSSSVLIPLFLSLSYSEVVFAVAFGTSGKGKCSERLIFCESPPFGKRRESDVHCSCSSLSLSLLPLTAFFSSEKSARLVGPNWRVAAAMERAEAGSDASARINFSRRRWCPFLTPDGQLSAATLEAELKSIH